MKAVCAEAFCCTRSNFHEFKNTNIVTDSLNKILDAAQEFQDSKDIKDLFKFYDLIFKADQKLDNSLAELSYQFVMRIADTLYTLCEKEYENENDNKYRFYSHFFLPKDHWSNLIESQLNSKIDSIVDLQVPKAFLFLFIYSYVIQKPANSTRSIKS